MPTPSLRTVHPKSIQAPISERQADGSFAEGAEIPNSLPNIQSRYILLRNRTISSWTAMSPTKRLYIPASLAPDVVT